MGSKWKYRLKELLTFSKKERLGFTVLLLIVLAVLLYPFVNFGAKEGNRLSLEEFVEKVDEAELQSEPDGSETFQLFTFDPNTADSLTFLRLGFSPRQVKSILSYRSTGAWFSQPDDFSKLYVVSEEQFQQVRPYIKIAQPYKPFKKVELNTADTTELQRLRGIGPYYARQIVRYREHLGGFCEAEQLKEIKGIDNDRFLLFAGQYTLNSELIKQLNVNTTAESTLKSHPYIGSEVARKIVEYRQTIPISSVEELVNAKIFTSDKADKILPYLLFD